MTVSAPAAATGSSMTVWKVECGLISAEDCDEASQAMADRASEKVRLGQILVERELVTLEELQWAVVCQMQARLQELFTWEDGSYAFQDGELPTEESILLEFDTRDLILEGIRRTDSVIINRDCPPLDTTLVRADGWDEAARGLNLTNTERRMLFSFGYRFKLGSAVAAGLFQEDVLLKSLYAFFVIGLLWTEEEARERATQPLEE